MATARLAMHHFEGHIGQQATELPTEGTWLAQIEPACSRRGLLLTVLMFATVAIVLQQKK
jgi:hypothetical protein